MDKTRTYRHRNRRRLGHLRGKQNKLLITEKIQKKSQITGYKVLGAGSINRLEEKVESRLKKGWIPVGGVSVCGGYGHAHFHQAMIREASQ